MWEIRNRTPFAAQGCFLRDRTGAEFWVVALRGRFIARADSLVDISHVQDAVRLAPTYRDEGAQELSAESDFAPFRPKADIALSGSACAPDKAAVRQSMVRMRVGLLEKSGRVTGQRRLRRPKGLHGRHAMDGPETYQEVPLTWRNCLGGTDPFARTEGTEADPHPENPVGRGWTARWANLPAGAELDLPLIEDPRRPLQLGEPVPPPHGFGALQPSWLPRRPRAGTYDEKWQSDRAPLPPDDFSEQFHQAVGDDQVYPGELRGGEPVSVEGLHPDGPYGFNLPQAIIEGQTRVGRDTVPGRFRIIGVDIDGTAKTVDIVWNMAIPCSGRDHIVDRSVIRIKQMAGVNMKG